MARKNKLPKCHRLCSPTAIDALFAARGAGGALAFPLRAVWLPRTNGKNSDVPLKVLFSVPKRRLRHAVDRVTMRRRIREAYRLNRHLADSLPEPLDLAFIYVGSTTLPYAKVERAMVKLLQGLQ